MIVVNGKEREVDVPIPLGALLDSLNVNRQIVAVELSGEIIPRERWDATEVRDGDRIEIVRMIGGGSV